jgi:hypothetical protein
VYALHLLLLLVYKYHPTYASKTINQITHIIKKLAMEMGKKKKPAPLALFLAILLIISCKSNH